MNIFFLLAVIIIGFSALFSDYKSTFHGTSVRMKTRTAIGITFLEFFLNITVICNGIIGAIYKYEKINKIDSTLNRVDEVLRMRWNSLNFVLVSIYVLSHQTSLIFVDVFFWFNLTPYSWAYAVCYFYMYIEIAIELQFAFIALNITYRFRKINECLCENLRTRISNYAYEYPSYLKPSGIVEELRLKVSITIC